MANVAKLCCIFASCNSKFKDDEKESHDFAAWRALAELL